MIPVPFPSGFPTRLDVNTLTLPRSRSGISRPVSSGGDCAGGGGLVVGSRCYAKLLYVRAKGRRTWGWAREAAAVVLEARRSKLGGARPCTAYMQDALFSLLINAKGRGLGCRKEYTSTGNSRRPYAT